MCETSTTYAAPCTPRTHDEQSGVGYNIASALTDELSLIEFFCSEPENSIIQINVVTLCRDLRLLKHMDLFSKFFRSTGKS